MEEMFKCVKCNVLKIRRRAEYRNERYHYRDNYGRLWRGHSCPKCVRGANRKYDKPKKPKIEKECVICKKKFLAHTAKVCGLRCRKKLNSLNVLASMERKLSTPVAGSA